jgi:hypothetical protein
VVQGEQRLREAEEERIRRETVERLWIITEELNILFKDNWTVLADKQMKSFQRQLREIEVKFKAKIIFFYNKIFYLRFYKNIVLYCIVMRRGQKLLRS